MLNFDHGERRDIAGRPFIETRRDSAGHAVYGPYVHLQPGRYAVDFAMALAGEEEGGWGNPLLAILDIGLDHGRRIAAAHKIHRRDLSTQMRHFPIAFTLDEPALVEFRAEVTGKAALLIDAYRRLVTLADDEADPLGRVAAERFPDFADAPEQLRAVETELRGMHEWGAVIRRAGAGALVTLAGVTFRVERHDDVNLVGELFVENAYRLAMRHDACVIDVGMNIGLAALRFAALPFVREVHGFEPFAATAERARANVALNPALAGKIRVNTLGLSDHDGDEVVTVGDFGDSAGMSIFRADDGTPHQLAIRDAAGALEPIIVAAEVKGLRVVVKVDCEGSEFAIFRSLERDGLLGRIDVFLVEWHAMFPGLSQATLIEPLERAGFVVFDRSPPEGNGFFTAVRAG